jgi:hypothetical protein
LTIRSTHRAARRKEYFAVHRTERNLGPMRTVSCRFIAGILVSPTTLSDIACRP